MENNQKPTGKKEAALNQVKVARSNLLLMIVLTAVNVVMLLAKSDVMLLFSATVPYYSVVFGTVFGNATQNSALIFAGIFFAAIIICIYLICWIFSKKHYGWMVTALVLFVLDTVALIALYVFIEDVSGILDFAIHIWVLYYLIIGVRFGYKLKHIPPEEELEYEMSQQSMPETTTLGNTFAMRAADPTVKHRVLVEGDFVGHHITYRRVKRVNELVIDGYIYDDVEMLVETAHSLEATVDGHQIQVGFDGAAHSYIRIDGETVAKKLRLY